MPSGPHDAIMGAMNLDVIDLKAFYATRLGRIAARLIQQRVRECWPKLDGRERLLGLGYATPFLAELGATAERTIAFMPAPQGIVPWQNGQGNAAALIRTDMLPLEGGSVDRVLAVHCLEHADNAHETLREVWRVLSPGGRLLAIVPSRAGLWARTEFTPFGHGRPFSRAQLTSLLRESMFEPVKLTRALALPPTQRSLFVHTGTGWERVGERFWPRFSGVLVVEAAKLVRQQIELSIRQPRARRVLSPALVPSANLRPRTRV